jgi:hypothetical protein
LKTCTTASGTGTHGERLGLTADGPPGRVVQVSAVAMKGSFRAWLQRVELQRSSEIDHDCRRQGCGLLSLRCDKHPLVHGY